MRRVAALAAAGTAAVVIACAAPAHAEGGAAVWEFGSDDEQDQVTVEGEAAGSEAELIVERRSSGGWRLIYVSEGDLACDPDQDGVADPSYAYMSPDGDFVEICRDTTAPPPIPRYLAEETVEEMSLPLAGVAMSPPEGSDHLVNLASWLWVDNWQPVTTSATLRGVTVTVTATPDSVTWDMGAGDPPVVCGPGRAYDPSVPDEEQSTDCSYTYRRSSFGEPNERFRGAATMRWSIAWTSSTGEAGALAPVSTRRPFTLRVAEGQAVVTDAR
jgi:hypothetical protein